MDTNAGYLDRYEHAVMNTFGPPLRTLVRGEGARVWDADGTEYLDLLGGLAVNSLGHAHPALIEAVSTQLGTLGHVCNFFASDPQISLAEELVGLATATSPAGTEGRVFFTNSGSEANETAFKLTRLTGRTKIIAFEGSFHGRTMGALALTATTRYRQPFEPLPGDITFVPYGDAAAVAEVMDDTVAAVVVEPLQGESGVVVPPAGFLPELRRLTTEAGALLWIDEVQTGIGRTGHWFAFEAAGVAPDIVTVAKGLAGGIPIGACIALGATGMRLGPGSHGNTFGGNPVATAAARAVLRTIVAEQLLPHATTVGEHIVAAIEGLGRPEISHVRGAGLLRAIVLTADIAPALATAALKAGFIVNAPRPDVVRLAPPLIITTEQVDAFVAALPELLAGAA